MAPLNGDEQNPEIIIFVDLVVLLCKGLQNVIVYQHEIQKLYGTSFSLFCSSPVTFDWILKKRRKIMLIRLKKNVDQMQKLPQNIQHAPTSGETILRSCPLHDGEETTCLQYAS